ncbi:patatin-like phospholipase family protein [Nocardia brasiliensis]|uniref:patatin-like phospholipase family protein n=1 Tax=Nocardia brasiliensis TaxID=37326 RepID=UPI00189448DB|nr:patatin-like phospholipase family protein [Nocardia brasiliensis]MBF6125368.1 patatin-like phospholipase family protein [Nocardia brasiliensis]MBF6544960.1 patatin-like phospholipase family protein [Nocardia brasiliensis]
MGNKNGSQRRGLAIGCGGTLGAAWIVAALAAVREVLDWDPREADVLIGTSAGAELVTMLGSGIAVPELVAMQDGTSANPILTAHLRSGPGRFPPVPRPRLGSLRLPLRRTGSGQRLLTAGSGLLPVGGGDASWLQQLAERLNPGRAWVPHPATWLVSMDYETGQRVPFGAPDAPTAPLGAALRASWAVPGWFPPVAIDGRRFIDGGAGSTASVDLLVPAKLDELVVLAPMASTGKIPASGPGHFLERQLRNRMSAALDAEIAQLRATGTKVLRIDATAADLAVMGPNFMDGRRRLDTFQHSLTSTRRAVEQGAFA